MINSLRVIRAMINKEKTDILRNKKMLIIMFLFPFPLPRLMLLSVLEP